MNKEIREHPLTIPKAGQLGILQDPETLKTHSFLLDPLLPSEAPVDIEWVSSEAAAGDYDTSVIRTYQGNIYRSEIDDNPDIPGTSANWTLLNRSYSLQMWQAGVYVDERVFVFYEWDFEGYKSTVLYELKTEQGRPYESTDFVSEVSNGSWRAVGSPQVIQMFAVFPDDLVNPVAAEEINTITISGIPKTRVFLNGDIDQSIFVKVNFNEVCEECFIGLTTTVDDVDIIMFAWTMAREAFDARWLEAGILGFPTFHCAAAGTYFFRLSWLSPGQIPIFEKITGPLIQI